MQNKPQLRVRALRVAMAGACHAGSAVLDLPPDIFMGVIPKLIVEGYRRELGRKANLVACPALHAWQRAVVGCELFRAQILSSDTALVESWDTRTSERNVNPTFFPVFRDRQTRIVLIPASTYKRDSNDKRRFDPPTHSCGSVWWIRDALVEAISLWHDARVYALIDALLKKYGPGVAGTDRIIGASARYMLTSVLQYNFLHGRAAYLDRLMDAEKEDVCDALREIEPTYIAKSSATMRARYLGIVDLGEQKDLVHVLGVAVRHRWEEAARVVITAMHHTLPTFVSNLSLPSEFFRKWHRYDAWNALVNYQWNTGRGTQRSGRAVTMPSYEGSLYDALTSRDDPKAARTLRRILCAQICHWCRVSQPTFAETIECTRIFCYLSNTSVVSDIAALDRAMSRLYAEPDPPLHLSRVPTNYRWYSGSNMPRLVDLQTVHPHELHTLLREAGYTGANDPLVDEMWNIVHRARPCPVGYMAAAKRAAVAETIDLS